MALSSFFNWIMAVNSSSADLFLIFRTTGFCSNTLRAYSLNFRQVVFEKCPCIIVYLLGFSRNDILDFAGGCSSFITQSFSLQNSFSVLPPTPEAKGARSNCATIEHLAGCRQGNLGTL